MKIQIVRSLFAFLLLCSLSCTALDGQEVLSETEKKDAIDDLAEQLNDRYVYPETGKKLSAHLQNQWEQGEYASLTSSTAFADRLTQDLQEISQDLHLRVRFEPEQNKHMREMYTQEDEFEIPESFLKALKRDNYGFQEIRILPGNVGYLDLRAFIDPADGNGNAGEVASAAMNYLAHADAILFDLRRNGGGSPGMIQLLTSFLYSDGERVHLNSFYFRPSDETTQTWTLPFVPGKRNPDAKIFVLTSRNTFSAAEEFTYNLKNLERGTIVGETTGGGAHPGGPVPIGEQFTAFIPIGRAINPVTGTNWEGTGVQPHVEVPAEQAFRKAFALALQELAEEAEGADKVYYKWFADIQVARSEGFQINPTQMKKVAGEYGPRKIFLENGDLYYQKNGRAKVKLEALNERTFLLEGDPAVKIEIEIEGDRGVAMTLSQPNGPRERAARNIQ